MRGVKIYVFEKPCPEMALLIYNLPSLLGEKDEIEEPKVLEVKIAFAFKLAWLRWIPPPSK